MGPVYCLWDLEAEYCTWRRALMCSTGVATKDTVQPARVPAMPWPSGGSLVSKSWEEEDEDEGEEV